MDEQIKETIPALIAAVETIMNVSATPADRQAAHQRCDSFKESSPICIQCGLVLAQLQYSPILRHFGLQLLEHSIRFRWNSLSDEDKNFLKKSCLELIAEGTKGILEEHAHVKDAVSRVAVEIVKREWPQMWPSLLNDLYKLCHKGETQTELVLKILLRLVEDVVTFQNVPTQRRREIMQALTSHMTELFDFFLNLFQQYSTKANATSSELNEAEKLVSLAHCTVSEAVLQTLSGYLDWVNMSMIFMKDGLLLQVLCLLLSRDSLQLYAAECLLIIVSRKGKLEERKPLLILFSEDAMSVIWNAAVAAERSSQDEYYYLFLKRLCQVLTELGKQLCALWGILEDIAQPPNFSKYLEALLAFTLHPSQMLSSFTQTLWTAFLRHETISKDPVLLSFIPRLVGTSAKTLLKVGFPTQTTCSSCDYARLDFDSDEEFNMFFSKHRNEIAETIRLATLKNPEVTFAFGAQWLRRVLQTPVNVGDHKVSENGNCNLSSPSFLDWDALTVFLESVMNKLMLSPEPKPDVNEGIELLKNVLKFDTQDPLILSSLLSCISTLFPFLNHTPETLSTVLEKIFSAVIFNIPGQTKGTRSRAVKNVRQHACSGLVKICKQYPELLFPVFDQLYNHIQMISRDPEQLSQMEKCILTEALILISNQFHNFEKQSAFVEEVLRPVKDLWLSAEFKEAFWSPEKFMSYVGLDQPPVEPSSADTCGINRSHITYCINTILAVMKRAKWPEDYQAAVKGGFVFNSPESGTPILRNPSTAHISVLLENVFALQKTMNANWLPEYLKLRHPDFSKAYDLLEVEKLAVLGIPPPCVDNSSFPACKQPLERMQHFLTTTHDMSCHILGNSGLCLGYEFYAAPNVAQSIMDSVLTNLDSLPDYRLRPVIRVFMKPYIQNCPKECFSQALLPVVNFLCPCIWQRLYAKWQVINQRQQNSFDNEEDNAESQEVLEDQLTRQLTREYIEMLGSLCYSRKADIASDERMMDDSETTVTQTKEDTLSELGQLCLKIESLYPSVVMCAFSGLSWNDTTTCNKCINLCWPLLKQLHTEGKLMAEAARHFLSAILLGLQLHGQHEACLAMLLSLGLQVYELLRPHFPDVMNVFLQIPNCTPNAVKSFDNMILGSTSPQKQLPEKKKKEAFKKLVSEIIGKNIGQQFKREVHYKNLPPLFRLKQKPPSLDEVETTDIGLCDLFKPSDGS